MDLSTPRRGRVTPTHGSAQRSIGGGSVHKRVEKTAAVADRIAKLVESMNQKLETVEADKAMMRQQMEEEELFKHQVQEKLEKLNVLEKRNEKFESIAEQMKMETRRIKEKEEELSKREKTLLDKQKEGPVILTVEKVREFYNRIVELGHGVATRTALLHALQTDNEIRGIFHDSQNHQASSYFESLFQSCERDDSEITWDDFKTTVFGHDPTPTTVLTTTRPLSPCESLISAPDPSPPPPRRPDFSPTGGLESTPSYARDPSPPLAHSSSSSRSSTPRTTEMQLSVMASILTGSGIDPHADIMLPPQLASANNVPFVDLTFPPAPSSASVDCVWARASGTLHPVSTPSSIAVVSGISSNRKFLSLLSLMGVPERIIDASLSSLPQGYVAVRLGCGLIVVDNFFPSIDMCAVHASAGPSHVWIMLAEKAFAKVKGSYALLEQSKDELDEVVRLVDPDATLVTFPISEETMNDFVQTAIEGHLQVLVPLPTAVSKLGDIGSVYCVEAVYPKGETDLSKSQCLVWCPVISQGAQDVEVDAQWMPVAELLQCFSTWGVVDVNGCFLPRREGAISFPPPPALALNETLDTEISNIKVEDSIESKEKSGAVDLGNWQDAMAAVMLNNTAVVKEVQAHKNEVEAAHKEIHELRVGLEGTRQQLATEREMMTQHMENERVATEQLNNERQLLEDELSQERQSKDIMLQELTMLENIKTEVEEELVQTDFTDGSLGSRVRRLAEMLEMERTEKANMIHYELASDGRGETLIAWGRSWRPTDVTIDSDTSMCRTIEELTSELKELRGQVSSMDTELIELRSERERVKIDNLKLGTDFEGIQIMCEEKEDLLQHLHSQVSALQTEKATLQDQVVNAEMICKEKSDEVRGLRNLLEELDSNSRMQISEAQAEAEKKIAESVGQIRTLQDSVEGTLKGADERYESLQRKYDRELQGRCGVQDAVKEAELKAQESEDELKITLQQLEYQKQAHLDEVSLLRSSNQELRKQVDVLQQEGEVHARVTADEQALRLELSTVMSLHKELSAKHAAVVREMEDMRNQRREMQKKKEAALDAQSSQESTKAELTAAQQEVATLYKRVKTDAEEKEHMQQQMDEARIEITQLLKELTETQDARQLSVSPLRADADRLRKENAELHRQFARLQHESAHEAETAQELERAREENAELCKREAAMAEEVERLQWGYTQLSQNTDSVEQLRAENAELRAALQQGGDENIAMMCDQLNTLQMELSQALRRAEVAEAALHNAPSRSPSQMSARDEMKEARMGRVASEVEYKDAEASRKDARIKELEMKYDLQGRELEMALEQVAKLYDEINVREERLEEFARDTQVLQNRVQELMQMANSKKESDIVRKLKEEAEEAKEGHRQVSMKWKRVATSLQELKKENGELKDAMRVAAREISALHASREEFKGFTDEQRARVAHRLEGQEEENKHLRMEMLKIISERNMLHEELSRRT